MLDRVYMLLSCHFLGDYVLQNDFLAKTKGENMWHMLAHCVLYTVPFSLCCGQGWKTAVLFASHILIDTMKARYNAIGYAMDQVLHLSILAVLYLIF